MSAPPPEVPEGLDPGRVPERVLVFSIDGRELGVPVGPVVEIIRDRGATPVPNAGPAVDGILPLRGRMVTVIDVRRGLALAPRRPGSRAQVIVLESSGDLLGLVVDKVMRVAGVAEGVGSLDLDDLVRGLS